jgi:hypothetical protein
VVQPESFGDLVRQYNQQNDSWRNDEQLKGSPRNSSQMNSPAKQLDCFKAHETNQANKKQNVGSAFPNFPIRVSDCHNVSYP